MEPSFTELEEIQQLSRKFFVGPGDDHKFRKWGEIAMELALNWLKNPEKRKIHTDLNLPELADLFGNPTIPEEGADIESVFQECREKILNNSVRVNNPRYIGHMTNVIPWFSVVIDILITSINQNQVKTETALASSYVERQTLAWMHSMVYQSDDSFYRKHIQSPDATFGNVTNGGTLGNLTALTVAREKVLPGVGKTGLVKALTTSGYSDVVVLASERVHYSVQKSMMLLGLGEDALVTVPVDENSRIRVDLLREKINTLKKKNVLIMAIIGIAGTTETGNIDPLDELANIAEKENIWYHVDAAWGGSFLLSSKIRTMLKGIKRADSVILDGHKLLYLPLAHGVVVFKSQYSLDRLRHNANYIIRKGSIDLGQTSLEGSRRFTALKLWFSLKMLGSSGYSALLKKSIQLTGQMKQLLDQSPYFERTNEPEVSILTYRYVPLDYQAELEEKRAEKDWKGVSALNERLNKINVELQKRQRNYGVSFVSRTTLKFHKYKEPIVVCRAVLTNLLTRYEDLKDVLKEQQEIGEAIYQERYTRR